jgi:hypothetical protein
MRKGTKVTGYVVIAMIAMIHMMLIGCNSETSSPASTGYHSDDDRDSEIVSNVQPEPIPLPKDVDQLIVAFESHQFAFVPQYTATMEGSIVPDGQIDAVDVTVTWYTMKYLPDTAQRIMIIQYVETEMGDYVQPLEIFFGESELTANCVEVSEGVWLNEYRAWSVGTLDRAADPTSQGDDFWKCFVGGSVMGCGTAAGGCIFTTVAWGVCTATVCGFAVVASGVACALMDLF